MLTETRAELDDFHQASKELEAELESELQRTEKAQQDLQAKANRAENERDEWKVRFNRGLRVYRATYMSFHCLDQVYVPSDNTQYDYHFSSARTRST